MAPLATSAEQNLKQARRIPTRARKEKMGKTGGFPINSPQFDNLETFRSFNDGPYSPPSTGADFKEYVQL
jgi:hypothetical protein